MGKQKLAKLTFQKHFNSAVKSDKAGTINVVSYLSIMLKTLYSGIRMVQPMYMH